MATPDNVLFAFKAGQCKEIEDEREVQCIKDAGILCLYMSETEELPILSWRPKDETSQNPTLDLVMVPGDASFTPYTRKDSPLDGDIVESPTNGRICLLKFQSSSERHLFWLQSRNLPNLPPSHFGPKDLKLVEIVGKILAGELDDLDDEIDTLHNLREEGDSADDDDDDDEDMNGGSSVPRLNANSSTGGAGAGATGGDVREEGKSAREGGEDGARAPSDDTFGYSAQATAFIDDFLRSKATKGQPATRGQGVQSEVYTTLPELLKPESCLSVLQTVPISIIDQLLTKVPPTLILLEICTDDLDNVEVTQEAADLVLQQLSDEQKRSVLERVIHSPQLSQSLNGLTVALREGGLPTVASALKIEVENGGLIRGGTLPLGGGSAVEAFVQGVANTVKKEREAQKQGENDRMDMT